MESLKNIIYEVVALELASPVVSAVEAGKTLSLITKRLVEEWAIAACASQVCGCSVPSIEAY